MAALTWNRYPSRAPDPKWADNWEDCPERLAHQEWVRSLKRRRR